MPVCSQQELLFTLVRGVAAGISFPTHACLLKSEITSTGIGVGPDGTCNDLAREQPDQDNSVETHTPALSEASLAVTRWEKLRESPQCNRGASPTSISSSCPASRLSLAEGHEE